MRKLYLLLSALIFIPLVCSCGEEKSPKQAAEESLKREQEIRQANEIRHKKYIDSLVNAAYGIE